MIDLKAELQDCSDRLDYIISRDNHLDNPEKISNRSRGPLDLLNKDLDILEEHIKELE